MESILQTILLKKPNVTWNEIGGNKAAKETLQEAVVLPMIRPEAFIENKLRAVPKGVLLYGPTGTGKTLLAKAAAFDSIAAFMNVSGADIGSRYVSESEKLVKVLFLVARALQPVIIFVDECDAIFGTRLSNEKSNDRKIKNQFLKEWDGILTKEKEKLLVLGATNRPSEIDAAIVRRFSHRLYIKLPDEQVSTFLQICKKDVGIKIYFN